MKIQLTCRFNPNSSSQNTSWSICINISKLNIYFHLFILSLTNTNTKKCKWYQICTRTFVKVLYGGTYINSVICACILSHNLNSVFISPIQYSFRSMCEFELV